MARFNTQDFQSQFSRSLGKVSCGFAEVGECFAVAERIVDGDTQSWYDEWSGLAEELHQRGDSCRSKGHVVSARHLFKRASEYYRQASFFHRVDLDCQELQSAYANCRTTLRAALDLEGRPWEAIAIPFEGKQLFGYLLLHDDDRAPRPTVVAPSGYDGSAEEMIPYIAGAALERGYNVLVFDGPGQGGTLYDRENRLFMRHDFEVPLKAAVDFALNRPEVDADALALYGTSFGGYLVPRGATAEHRAAAMIADPGQHDIGGALTARLPAELMARLHDETDESDQAFEVLRSTPDGHLLFDPRMAAHGVSTVREYVAAMTEFRIPPEMAADISCRSLICDNESDVVSTGQGRELSDMMTCPHEYLEFTEREGAGGHTEIVGRQIFFEKAFDWLDTVLGVSTRNGVTR